MSFYRAIITIVFLAATSANAGTSVNRLFVQFTKASDIFVEMGASNASTDIRAQGIFSSLSAGSVRVLGYNEAGIKVFDSKTTGAFYFTLIVLGSNPNEYAVLNQCVSMASALATTPNSLRGIRFEVNMQPGKTIDANLTSIATTFDKVVVKSVSCLL